MDETLWPCRGVAEYAYCPRLFYYMTVEGVFIPSHDTEEGARVHKRVNRPSASAGAKEDEPEEDADSDRPRTIRSLALTSERLGLTARLDLAEISGTTATPVEYRKGRPRRAQAPAPPVDEMMEDSLPFERPEPWPTDRVQIGLQAILLEEAGYEVHEAVLYYAAEKLRLRIDVDDALKTEALEALSAAKNAAEGPRQRQRESVGSPVPLVVGRVTGLGRVARPPFMVASVSCRTPFASKKPVFSGGRLE